MNDSTSMSSEVLEEQIEELARIHRSTLMCQSKRNVLLLDECRRWQAVTEEASRLAGAMAEELSATNEQLQNERTRLEEMDLEHRRRRHALDAKRRILHERMQRLRLLRLDFNEAQTTRERVLRGQLARAEAGGRKGASFSGGGGDGDDASHSARRVGAVRVKAGREGTTATRQQWGPGGAPVGRSPSAGSQQSSHLVSMSSTASTAEHERRAAVARGHAASASTPAVAAQPRAADDSAGIGPSVRDDAAAQERPNHAGGADASDSAAEPHIVFITTNTTTSGIEEICDDTAAALPNSDLSTRHDGGSDQQLRGAARHPAVDHHDALRRPQHQQVQERHASSNDCVIFFTTSTTAETSVSEVNRNDEGHDNAGDHAAGAVIQRTSPPDAPLLPSKDGEGSTTASYYYTTITI